ncbi:hypothetical protein NDU88_011819 [Pleurodeles waltl]|uniref:RING-type domain-containing protein n=1 Tax=Pleurodeles waltl TaxID=8319 RepID=A0AAV7R468_PLEWA|nr:hypothetical protein NDU88_011819 [Pleurodeles waltl]
MEFGLAALHHAGLEETGPEVQTVGLATQGAARETPHQADPGQHPLQPGPQEIQHQAHLEEELMVIPECPICYLTYDNVFKSPMLLCCAHTFCLECLARMCLFLKQMQMFQCPLCRTEQVIPLGGVPKLRVNVDILAKLDAGTQIPQEVWVDGHKLCCISAQASPQGQASDTLVTVQLLSNPSSQNAGPEGLVDVGHDTRVYCCRTSYKAIWSMSFLIFTVLVLFFTILFIPMYLKQK